MNLEIFYLYAAVGGGAVLLVQLAMLMLSGDDGGLDTAHPGDLQSGGGGVTDSDGLWFFEIISIRTLAAAATFFGLVGGALNATGASFGVSLVAALLAGYGAMYAVYWAFKQIFRLETSGNEDVYNAIGQTAEVYVPIAASGKSPGKVLLVLQGRTAEYQALTDSDRPLATGAKVLVTDVVSNDTLRVSPIPPAELPR